MPWEPAAFASAPPLPNLPLTDAIVRRRWVLWGILIVIYALTFTGQWRMGRDSALYRGLGHALATGRGYHFGEYGSTQVYPGLPVLLAGLEKVFSLAAWPGILVMHGLALGCLILTYKLVRLRFPQWVAISVTFGVGMNSWFLELTNELLTDIPFLFGLMLAIYGWERLRLATIERDNAAETPKSHLAMPLAALICGLALAAVMRPTFLVLAGAWVLVCIWGVIAGPKRKFYILCLAVLGVVCLAKAATDPRVRGLNFLKGGYERDAIHSMGQLADNVKRNVPELTDREMNYAFFGQRWWPTSSHLLGIYVPGMTDVMSVLAILTALLLWRTNPLWTLLIFLTVAVTLVMTVVPRYYIMVLPLMMLGWTLMTIEIARRVPRRWMEVVLLGGSLLVVIPNATRGMRLIGEQHQWGRETDDETPKWQYVIDMGNQVNKLVPPGEKVIAPASSIMSFVSDRECVMQRDILPSNKSPVHYPEHLKALNIKYAVYPSRLYRKGERTIRDLMDRGVIVPLERVAKQGEMALVRIEIKVPPPGVDWRTQAVTEAPFTVKTTSSGTTRPSAKVIAAKKRKALAAHKAEVARKAKIHAKMEKERRRKRQEALEKAAAKKRKIKRAKKAAAATRQSTTAPTSGPVSLIDSHSSMWLTASNDSECHPEVLRRIWHRSTNDADPSEYLRMTVLADATSETRLWMAAQSLRRRC